MKLLLGIVAAAEAATGVMLFIIPSVVTRLLFGAEVSGAGAIMSRLAGIALVALSVACWPGPPSRAVHGMFTFGTLAALYLIYLGCSRELTGILLWPAVGAHVVISVLLAVAWKWTRT